MSYTRTAKGVRGLHCSPKRNKGFGLIEILVSLLVLAVGLLGLASLQTTGLTQNSEARHRSQAILLADDMFERIRANRENIASYVVTAGTAPTCDSDYAVSAVTNSGVAADDIAEWRNSLGCLLPGGNGTVQVNNTTVTIQVTWDTNTGSTDDGSVSIEARI